MVLTFRPPVLETAARDYFEPARPTPLDRAPTRWQLVRRARDNLVSCWMEEHYRTGVWSFRVLGRQVVVANEPEAVKTVLASSGPLFERKAPPMRRALEVLLGDGLFISDGETWRRRRPLVADIVHKNRVPVFAPTMEDAALGLARRWGQRPPGTVFDAFTDMAELTAEIIARAVFGRHLEPRRAVAIVAGFGRYQSQVDNFNLGYFLGSDEGWPVWRGLRLRSSTRQVHAAIDAVLREHLEGHGDEGSMVASLLRLRDRRPELGLGIDALRNEAATIFMAGHETTAATLTWVWYLLAGAPWVEAALHAELEAVLGERAPTFADVPRLAWCRAIVEEALRLYPPVPMLPRQAAAATRIGSAAVDKAALVLVSPWLLHRAVDLWHKPERFMPERFLGADRPKPYSYIPFSAGTRICAGLTFGLSESVLCLAVLARRFSVRLAPGARVEPVCRLTLRPRGGLPVIATPRP
ncbi:MAG: cytochrome P450 [Alsobacter sp.]